MGRLIAEQAFTSVWAPHEALCSIFAGVEGLSCLLPAVTAMNSAPACPSTRGDLPTATGPGDT
eukprot:7322238-Heterocapsa_arctica.AAC.1